MNRPTPRTLLMLALTCALTLAGAAGAAPPPSRYPLDLNTAIAKAYPTTFAGIQRSCTVWLNGGRDEYALATVILKNGHVATAGFQFINTAGWFNMWRSHAPTAASPRARRPPSPGSCTKPRRDAAHVGARSRQRLPEQPASKIGRPPPGRRSGGDPATRSRRRTSEFFGVIRPVRGDVGCGG
jgi:hypothetical protein